MHITLDPVTLPVLPQMRLAGGPRFSNTYLEDSARDPQSNIMWDEAKWEWTLRFVRGSTEYGLARGFWLARGGGAYGWLFEDPFDHSSTDGGGWGYARLEADGKRYLYKFYPDSFRPYARRIRCPRLETLDWGTVPGHPQVDPYTGIITGATGDGYCSFSFYCPVAFASDFHETDKGAKNEPASWTIPIIELGKFVVASRV